MFENNQAMYFYTLFVADIIKEKQLMQVLTVKKKKMSFFEPSSFQLY